MGSRRSRVAVVALVAVGVAALAGCSADPPAGSPSAAPSAAPALASTAPASTALASPVPDPSTVPSPAATTPARAAYASTIGGAAVRYPSGLAVQVPSATRYTPSSLAVGTVDGHTGVVVTVRIANRAPTPLVASLVTVALRAGAAETIAPQVFDAPNGYGVGLTADVPPGRSVLARYAFDVAPADLSRLQVRVTPNLRQPDSAQFTGAAAPVRRARPRSSSASPSG